MMKMSSLLSNITSRTKTLSFVVETTSATAAATAVLISLSHARLTHDYTDAEIESPICQDKNLSVPRERTKFLSELCGTAHSSGDMGGNT